MDKAKHEYHELQKTIQQISTKNTTEKSKLERYKKKLQALTHSSYFLL